MQYPSDPNLKLYEPGYEKRFGTTPSGFVVGGGDGTKTPEQLKAEYEQNVKGTALGGAQLLQDLAAYSPTGQSGYGDLYTRAQTDPSLLNKFYGESDADALMRLKSNIMEAEQRQGRRQALHSEMGSGNEFVVSGQPYGDLESSPYGGVGLMGALENMRRIQGLNPQMQDVNSVISALTGEPTKVATAPASQIQNLPSASPVIANGALTQASPTLPASTSSPQRSLEEIYKEPVRSEQEPTIQKNPLIRMQDPKDDVQSYKEVGRKNGWVFYQTYDYYGNPVGKPFPLNAGNTIGKDLLSTGLMMANFALPGIGTGLSGALSSVAPGALATGSIANQALTNAVMSGVTSKLSGGDFGEGFVRGGLTPVVGAGVGSMIPAGFAAANPQLANAIRGVGTGAIIAGLTGGDFGQALTSGATSAAINAGMNATLGQIPGYTDLSPAARSAVNQIVGTAIRGGNIDPIRVAISAINAQMAEDAAKARKPRRPGGLASGGAVRGYFDGGEVYDFNDYGEFDDWWSPVDIGSDEYNWWDPVDVTQPENITIVGEKPEPRDPYEGLYGETDIIPQPIEIPEIVGGEEEYPDVTVTAPRETCPPGTHVDEDGECVPDVTTPPVRSALECPEGYVYSDSEQACVKLPTTTTQQQPRTQPPKPPQPPRSGGLSVAGGSQTNINIPPVQQPAPLTLQTLRNEGGAGGFQDPLARLRDIIGEMRPTSAPAYKMDPYLESLVNQPSKSGYFTYGREPSMDEVFGMGRGFADGGQVESFSHLAAPLMAEGGGHMGGREDFRDGKHVSGPGDGQSDDIPAWLADGEFVFPADVVAALGNGSTKAGTDKLYDMMHNIRKYHRSADPEDLPPEAKKSPLDYLSKGKKGAKA